MSDAMPIPVDAVVAQALEKRPVHAVGSTVWVRRSDNGTVEPNHVLGVFMVMTNTVAFHMHYLVASPYDKARGVISRRIVPWHHVHPSYDEAVRAGTHRPPVDDPLDIDILVAVQQHRKQVVQHARRA